MTPVALLGALRAKGYSVGAEGVSLVVKRDTAPPNEAATLALLRAAKPDLVMLLETEQHPFVRAVCDVFSDARLTGVTTSDGRVIR